MLSGHNPGSCWPKWKTARYLPCWVEIQSPVPCLRSPEIFSCNSWFTSVLWGSGNSRSSLALPTHFGGDFPIELRGHHSFACENMNQSFKHLFSSSNVLSPKNSLKGRAKLRCADVQWRRPQAMGFLGRWGADWGPGLCWSEEGEAWVWGMCRLHAASCQTQRSQPGMPWEVLLSKIRLRVIQDHLTNRSHELPLFSTLAQIFHYKQKCQVLHLNS